MPASADPVTLFSAPNNGNPVTCGYGSLCSGPLFVTIDQPNAYGGNYRYYSDPLGSVDSGLSWAIGGSASGINPIGVNLWNVTFGACGNLSCITNESAPFPVYATVPLGQDSVVFGYLGPNGATSPPGPPAPDILPSQGEDAYTVALGTKTYAETLVGFFGKPSDSSVTLNLGGTWGSTYDARLEGQNVVLQGSGSFSTGGYLYIAGNVTVNGGTLNGASTVIDNDYAYLSQAPGTAGNAPTWGSDAPDTTTLTLNGATSKLTAQYLTVGDASANGSAFLNLTNGASASVGALYAGFGAGTYGSILIDNSTLTATDYAEIGGDGIGVLTVRNGGKASFTTSSGDIYLGYEGASRGLATVTGAGSSLTTDGFLLVGDSNGNSSLTVGNGATVTDKDVLVVGNYGAGADTMTISDGAKVTSSAISGAPDDFAGVVGSATAGTNGSVTITGSGSLWDLKQSLSIGAGGTGVVTVSAGGALEVEGSDIYLGHYAGGNGTLVLDGSSSTLQAPNATIHVGAGGTGEIDIQNGATLDESGKTMVLGEESTGDGTVKVTGGTFNVAVLTIGGAGNGTLTLDGSQAPATADISGSTLVLGRDGGSQGTLNLISPQARLQFGGTLQDGLGGFGQINLSKGATFTAQSVELGASPFGVGNLFVEDPNSSFTVASNGPLTLGSGTIDIENGGKITSGTVDIGANATTNSVLTIGTVAGGSAAPGILTVTGDLYVGDAGQGTMTVANGQATVSGNLQVRPTGNLAIAPGTSGQTATLSYGGALTVNMGGVIDISQGGALKATGSSTDTILGTVAVSGRGSDWNSPNSEEDFSGNSVLNVTAGAHAEFQRLNIGGSLATGPSSASGSPQVKIDGDGTAVMVSGNFDAGSGTSLTISGGAALTISGSGIGAGIGIVGSATMIDVTGQNSTLDLGKASLQVGGPESDGAIKVESMGTFISGDTTVAGTSADSTYVEVTGDLSTWTAGDIQLGDASAIKVESNATLTANSIQTPQIGSSIVRIDGGIVNVADNFGVSGDGETNSPNFNVVNGAKVTIGGDLTVQNQLNSNASTLANIPAEKGVLQTGFIDDSILSASSISVTNAELDLRDNARVSVTGGGLPSLGVFQGIVTMDSSSSLSGLQTVLIGPSGTIDLSDGGQLSIGNSLNLQNGNVVLGIEGTLVVGTDAFGGSLSPAAGQVLVGQTGSITGIGTIYGDLLNRAGVIHIGDDPGVLTVVGNFSQGSAGKLQIEVGPSSYSQLVVSGSAALGGTLQFETVAGGMVKLGQQYNVVMAAGGISGNFSAFSSGSPFVALAGTVSNGVLDLTASHTPNSFAAVAATSNQAAVASALDRAAATVTSGDLFNGIITLANASPAQVQSSFDSLSGEAYGDFATVGINTARLFGDLMQDRMVDIENGAGDVIHLAVGGTNGDLQLQTAVAPDGTASAQATTPNRRYHVWAEGIGSFGGIGSEQTAGSHAFDFSTYGGAGGFDLQLAPHWFAGGAFDYGHSSLTAHSLFSSGTADAYAFALYSSLTFGRAYVNGAAGYSFNDERLTRGLSLAGVASSATGKPTAGVVFTSIETGYQWPLTTRLTATPFLQLDAASFAQGAFTETGASDFDLQVAHHTTDSVESTLGTKLTRTFDTPWGVPLNATLKAAWGHEFADTARPLTAAFAGAPLLPFTVEGAHVDRNVAVVGASLSATAHNVTLFAKFDGQYGGSSRASSVTTGLSVAW